MSTIGNTLYQLPDPDLIAQTISHTRALYQATNDAIIAGAKRAEKDSEPWQARKNNNAANPLGHSPLDHTV